MVSLLLAGGADLNDEDSNGNSILHLCVVHSLTDMYAFLKTEWIKRYASRPNPALWRRTNLERHTPLTLAAKLGLQEMFSFLLTEERTVEWAYGPVSCVLVPLEGVDLPLATDCAAPSVIYSTDASDASPSSSTHSPRPSFSARAHRAPSVLGRGDGALELILRYAHLDLLMHPQVLELIEKKWDRFARRIFWKRCILSLAYLVIFTLTTVMRMTTHEQESAALMVSKGDSDGETAASSSTAHPPVEYDPIGMFENVDSFLLDLLFSPLDLRSVLSAHATWQYLGEAIVVLGAMAKGWWEVREVRKFGLASYRNATGSALLENVLSITFCVCIAIVLLLTMINSPLERAVLAIASITAWAYCFFFLLAFRLTGPMVSGCSRRTQSSHEHYGN
jgi:hypothetical protein